jgi:ABC-type transport system involved in cytochrome bd biosynthesis fused ATPase/permease subunit
MRPLDPRLLHRTRSARPLLVIDTALGLATALTVLLQAGVLARIAARGFAGTSVRALAPEFLLLVIAFVLRGGFTWGMEIAGRRAAWSVLSELRLAVVESRLRAQPLAVDGTGGGELAAVAVQGIEALEGYFARYLPQVVLASVVPLLVVVWVAFVDVESAVIMLLTLPLVPVFMWLIGRYTEQRTRERWEALRRLSTHFLDVVRGLPTLRAFGRADHQVAVLGEISERYRRATMGTLHVSFLSGSVLELAATLGVALVAVAAGVRLVGGGLGLEAGLTVSARSSTQARTVWRWRSGCSRCSTRRQRLLGAARRRRRVRRGRRCGSSTSRSHTRRAPGSCSTN